jgi:UDP-N-acetylglucosamine acyltransferase
VGHHTILSNNAALAGHVEVDDWAILGGYTLVHQFCKIGAHAFTSMGSKINCDVAPYVVVAGEMSAPKGINVEGLKRRGFTPTQIQAIRRAYKALYTSGLRLEEARLELGRLAAEHDAVAPMLAFLDRSTRSLLR